MQSGTVWARTLRMDMSLVESPWLAIWVMKAWLVKQDPDTKWSQEELKISVSPRSPHHPHTKEFHNCGSLWTNDPCWKQSAACQHSGWGWSTFPHHRVKCTAQDCRAPFAWALLCGDSEVRTLERSSCPSTLPKDAGLDCWPYKSRNCWTIDILTSSHFLCPKQGWQNHMKKWWFDWTEAPWILVCS